MIRERRTFVAIVKPGTHRHRASIYVVFAETPHYARRFIGQAHPVAVKSVALRDITGAESLRRGGILTSRIPPAKRLWSVQ